MQEILFEFRKIGRYVRVSAIDAETGQEVHIVGDPTKSMEYLKSLAAKKLMYVLNKN